MSDGLKLVIVTPQKPVLEKHVESVVLPAYEGEMGILKGHVPCILQLKEGLLRYRSSSEYDEFAVMGGFAEVYNNEVAVFAEGAELADEVDEEKARQEMQKLKGALLAREKGFDIATAEATLRRDAVRIKLLQRNKFRPGKKDGLK